jgi:hypothetical protein
MRFVGLKNDFRYLMDGMAAATKELRAAAE